MPPIPHKSDGYHVFLASPDDVLEERELVRRFFTNYNRNMARHHGLQFTVLDWEHYANAGIGRPQELITTSTLDPHRDSLVLFIGIMGSKFGSPTGKYQSATEEEFFWAMNTYREQQFPEIKWFFRKDYDIKLVPRDPKQLGHFASQWEKVCEFREQRWKESLCREFTDTDNFRDVLENELGNWLNHPQRPWNAALASAKKRPARKKAPLPPALPTVTTAQRDKLLADYLAHVIGETKDLPLRGIHLPNGEQLHVQLERVFVSLKARPTRAGDLEDPGRGKRRLGRLGDEKDETAALTMEATLKRHRHLVILGSPGSGKTTLSQFVALCYAHDRADSGSTWVRDRLQLTEQSAVPLLFFLRDFGKYLQDHAPVNDGTEGAGRLLEFLHERLQKNTLPLPKGFFEDDLRSGRAVVVFDGMDEVGDFALRRRVARMIENFASVYSRCRIVVTSRIVGYDEARIDGDFATMTIDTFSDDDVRQFLQQWHGHVAELDCGGPGERAQRLAKENTDRLLSEIDTHDRLRDLAVNPLILTIIALVHREDVKLPERRVELYARVIELMLGRRDERREIKSEAVFDSLTFGLEERQEVFQAIALDMHAKAAKEIDRGDLQDLLTADFRQRIDNRAAAKRAVERFLSTVLERTGLLVDAGNKSFSFAHLSFQEYLAAQGLADSDDYLAETLSHLTDPFWRETILLEFGCLSKSRRNRLLKAMCDAPVPPEQGQPLHNLVLAADCLHDAGLEKTDVAVLTDLRQRLQAARDEPLPEVDESRLEDETVQEERRVFAVRRVTAAWALERIADDAKSAEEALALEHPYWSATCGEPEWVTIPAGKFTMGGASGDDMADDDEKPRHRVFVSEFRLARTPVTNVQYWLYVQETGADPPKHWRGKSPAREIWTHPVVYVSWDDVQAYCVWLGAKIGKPVRLPTEAEWEKAARGDQDTRRYPWGDQFDGARCNSGELWEESEAGGTSPVGIFPEGASPYGCLDMGGNVWEWTQDWYGEHYYQQSPQRDPRGPQQGKGRVLRGGSWLSVAPNLRVSLRCRYDPGNRYVFVGFRCAV